jgi:glycine/D-amino acid oxidase-like deaminating enzyme
MNTLVIGVGIVGLSVAFELQRSGREVLVLAADAPGALQSSGCSRIFRLAHADAQLTAAAAQAGVGWEAWERLAGRTLLDHDGLLLTGAAPDRIACLRAHGAYGSAAGAAHALAAAQPHWTRDTFGATIRADDTIAFLAASVPIRRARVAAAHADGVLLDDGERVRADQVVVCAGPETYGLLGLPSVPCFRYVRFSFPLRNHDEALPCWIQADPQLCAPFYALTDGPDFFAVGLSECVDAELDEALVIADHARRVTAIVRELLPGVIPDAADERTMSCRHPSNERGAQDSYRLNGWDLVDHHGMLGLTGPNLFKFAPLLGALVVERLAGTSAATRRLGPALAARRRAEHPRRPAPRHRRPAGV